MKLKRDEYTDTDTLIVSNNTCPPFVLKFHKK